MSKATWPRSISVWIRIQNFDSELQHCLYYNKLVPLSFVEISSLLLPFLSFLPFFAFFSFSFPSLSLPSFFAFFFFFLVCIHHPNTLSYSEAMEQFVKPILETIKIITLDTKSRVSRTFLLCRVLTEYSLYAENLVSLVRCLKVLFCFSFPKGDTNCWFKLKGKISTLCVPFILHPISLEKEQN